MSCPFTLAACAEMLWTDQPIAWRLRRLTEMGFLAEIWDWTQHDIADLEGSGATFSSMTGYISGRLTDDAGATELLETAKASIAVAQRIGCPRLNLHGTGLGPGGRPVTPMHTINGADWLKARDTLERLADLAEQHGVTFVLENLNTALDHPGVPFARAQDTLALVSSINRPGLRLNLDLYHAQIGEGHLIELCRQAMPWIGEIQVADVPGRMEPGTGEISYPAIARALAAMGYSGVIGMEALASGPPEDALAAFRTAFTL